MTKNATTWYPVEGSGEVDNSNEDIERTTESGVTRITESSVTRVLEDTAYTPKSSTVWAESDT